MNDEMNSPDTPRSSSIFTHSSPAASIFSNKQQNELPIRTACNFCRSKKIKCDKTAVEDGGCSRCKREGIQCCYDVRDPIGRPRKRRATEESLSSEQQQQEGGGGGGREGREGSNLNHKVEIGSINSFSHSNSKRSSLNGAIIHSPTSSSSFSLYPTQRTSLNAPFMPIMPPPFASSSQWSNSPSSSFLQTAQSFSNSNNQSIHNGNHLVQNNANSTPRFMPNGIQSSSQSLSPTSQSIYSAATSSHGMTPSSTTTLDAPRPSNMEDAPNLSDLGLAAFLESLDTLEIHPEDGLTSSMLEALAATSMQENLVNTNSSSNFSLSPQQQSFLPSLTTPLNTFTNSTNLQGSTSYAVPADLSWADSSWLDEISNRSASLLQKSNQSISGKSSNTKEVLNVSNRPISSILTSKSWPRGPESGMGQGELRTLDGRLLYRSPSNGSSSKEKTKNEDGHSCCRKDEKQELLSSSSLASVGTRSISNNGDSPTRVHCVPNPTGKGCTCLCDVSVALINVRATLRQAKEEQVENGKPFEYTGNGDNKKAATTLQLTLSASQAVAAQCACSASCPTCRTDPSTSLSASLLVSTALQIYIRAVRTLRQGFGAGESRSMLTRSPSSNENGMNSYGGSEWDVSIGQYKPKSTNARRIALFAMKLELRDLRDAIAKVSKAASNSSNSQGSFQSQKSSHLSNNNHQSPISSPEKKKCCSSTSKARNSSQQSEKDIEVAKIIDSQNLVDSCVNPVDQVVIRKLHQQLGDLLRTVEGIEEQQDAERLAQSMDYDFA